MEHKKLKLGVASDLHLEFYNNWKTKVPVFEQDCDLIVLAGDIATGDLLYEGVCDIARRHPDSDIVVVAGNHEFYGYEYHERLRAMREKINSIEQVHFLENNTVNVNGYNILGCTLWTGFDIWADSLIEVSQDCCRHAISDFKEIRYGAEYLDPVDITLFYKASRTWLAHELSGMDCSRSIVVTHFPPCEETTHPAFGLSSTTSYFQASCLDLIEEYQPALWVYGHNHWSQDLTIGKTRLYSNQLGYPNEEKSIPPFSLDSIIE